MPSQFTGNHEKALRGRESAFDRKLQQLRTTGEMQKPAQPQQAINRKLTAEYEHPSMDSKGTDAVPLNELETLAFIDPITGMLNQRTLVSRIKDQIGRANRYRHPLGVVIMEIDEFDRIAAAAPQFAIENLIRTVANLIRKGIREVDMLGRCEGGKFVVICPESSIGQLSIVGNRLRNQFASAPLASMGFTLAVTVSAGVSAYPQTGETAEAVLEAASEALASAKEHGGNFLAEPNTLRKTQPSGMYGSFTITANHEPLLTDTVDFSPSAAGGAPAEMAVAGGQSSTSPNSDTAQTSEYVKPVIQNPALASPAPVVTTSEVSA